MLKIVFKGLEKSQLALDIVTEKFEDLSEKFPELKSHQMDIFLTMNNSRLKAGRDEFGVKLIIKGHKYGGIIVEKKDTSLYAALDSLLLVSQQRLNGKGDKVRVKARNLLRKKKQTVSYGS